ncbi:MAG: DNA translocase FtsK 4TM domain-containing protein [Succinivibrio sp.]|nr:DNA translocase FtsK 4TM domain-containing protein [Succinivibrio sp.]
MISSRLGKGAGKVENSSTFRKILFIACVLVASIFIYLLLDFRHTATVAMTGELVSGSSSGLTAHSSSFLGYVFDYFGSVTYIFPILFVCVVWMIVLRRKKIKEIDFFAVGLRILGFNLIVIGFCAVFSGLVNYGTTGAGGILGDFINIQFFKQFPPVVAALIPVLVSLAGIMLFIARSPLWCCDYIGSWVMNLVTFGRDKTPESSQDSSGAAGQKARSSMFDNIRLATEDKSAKERIEPVKGHHHNDVEPSFGPTLNEPLKNLSSGIDNRDNGSAGVQGMFGGVSSDDRMKPAAEPLIKPVLTPKPQVREPLFELSAQKSEFSGGNYQNRSFENRSDSAPSGYRTAASFSEQYSSKAADTESLKVTDSNAPATIIRDTRLEAATAAAATTAPVGEPRDDRPGTIITKYTEPVNIPRRFSTAASSSFDDSYSEEKDNGVSSTIITKYDGSLARAADLQLPPRAHDISTVITKSTTVSGVELSGSIPEDMLRESAESSSAVREKGDTLLDNSFAGNALHTDYTDADGNADFDKGFVPDFQSSEEENIIPFETRSEDPGSIEVDSLTSAFVPSDRDENYDGSPLMPNRSRVISEKDNDYSSYNTYGSRGISSQELTESYKTGEQSEDQSFQNSSISADNGASLTSEGRNDDLMNGFPSHQPTDDLPDSESASDFDDYPGEHLPDYQESAADIPENLLREPEQKPVTQFPTRDYVTSTVTAPERPYDSWRPSLDLLASSSGNLEITEEELTHKIQEINEFLYNFKVKAKVADYNTGPVITRFDLLLDNGVRSQTISSLKIDLQRVMQVQNIRVLDVIEGTPYVGLEVPNESRQMITLRDVVSKPEFQGTNAALPLCMGVDSVGAPVISDLSKHPHLLIAGTTGSGKSAGINSMLLSLLLTRSPSELRLMLVDPKQIEFALYEDLPHLITPIITEVKETVAALKWCVGEMERRYMLIKALGVRKLSEYNAKIKQANAAGQSVYDPMWSPEMGGRPVELKTLPFIVVVVDEFADLMAASGRSKKGDVSTESLLARLAAKARAAGIHLILATQTPRADIVTGAIRANMPSRVAYTVQSATESRIILDEGGAENLLGNGDMLAKLMDTNGFRAFRAHGPFASNSDVINVVDAWKERGAPEYIEGVTDDADEEEEGFQEQDDAQSPRALDKIFDKVAGYAREYQTKNGREVSISAIQVEFNVGYTRAKRLMNQLKQEGVVGD